MIAIILPTRGFLFTRVLQAIEVERAFHDVRIYTSEGLPLPFAQNALVEEAISDEKVIGRFTHFFFIEEDTVPPTDGLADLIFADTDIAFIDYGVGGWSCSARSKDGEILWCGLGCTLVKREVFDKVEYPWFRSDKTLRLNDWTWQDNPAKYGGQDIWFSTMAKEAGCNIEQVKGECRHLKLDKMGRQEVNNGLHLIKEKPKITKLQVIERS